MSIERLLQGLVDQLGEAWNRRDGSSFSRLFAENADYVTASGIRLAGRAQIHEALFRTAPVLMETGRVSLATQSIKTLGPDAALILCGWHMGPGHAAEPQEATVRSGLMTIVVQRAGETWHIVALHNTDITH